MIVSTEFHFRDNMGRFMAACDAAAVRSAEEIGDLMERRARGLAPSGPARSDYGRRMKLKPSIGTRHVDLKTVAIFARAQHAGAIEEGAGPHLIPNAFGRGITVLHPGNGAQPFLMPAYDAAVAAWRTILSRNYPG